mmetsp:Transcript_90469/g.292833  ORF Transcript_90469/g.292833 Transcript_90469/m.292833 type:complete len:142 (-) Transcript_90469:21-446(-)
MPNAFHSQMNIASRLPPLAINATEEAAKYDHQVQASEYGLPRNVEAKGDQHEQQAGPMASITKTHLQAVATMALNTRMGKVKKAPTTEAHDEAPSTFLGGCARTSRMSPQPGGLLIMSSSIRKKCGKAQNKARIGWDDSHP